MNEPVAVLRILVRGGVVTLWPWAIVAISLLVNLAFYAVVEDQAISRQSGGMLSLFATAIVATSQSWTRVLPFTIGQGGTRRGFLGGMGLFVLAQSLVAGLALTALGGIERASNGWGVGMRFFRTDQLDQINPVGRIALLACLFLAVGALGGLVGAVLVRWGSAGVWSLSVGAALLASAVLIVLTWRGALSTVLVELGRRSWLELWIGYPLVVAAGGALGSWLVVRRAAVR